MPNKIEDRPVFLAFKRILKDNASGELIVKGSNFEKQLYFQNGNLVFAKSSLVQERFGEVLFKSGKVDRSQYTKIQELVEGKTDKIGVLLVKNNMLSQQDVFLTLIYQAKSIMSSTFSIVSGEWNFVPGATELFQGLKFSIDLPALIVEGVKNSNNMEYFKKKYISLSPTMLKIPKNIFQFLSNDLIAFLERLDKLSDLTIEQLIEKFQMDEVSFWKHVGSLFLLNVIDFEEVQNESVENDESLEEITDLYNHLKSEKFNYYEVFGLQPSADIDDIKSAYFSFAKKFHPDRVSNSDKPEVSDMANFVFAEINKAYDILSNDAKKKKYDDEGFKDDSSDGVRKEKSIERAQSLFNRGKKLYAQGKFWETATVMDEAVRLDDSKIAYFLLLGQAQIFVPNLTRMAEKNLMKVVKTDRWNDDAYVALGTLFETENLKQRAVGFYQKALNINPKNEAARKKLTGIQETPQKKKFSLFKKSGK